MSRPCTVCTDPGVQQVDSRLRAGASQREVARASGIARSTIARHVAHTDLGHREVAGSPEGAHRRAAEGLIAEVRVTLGDAYGHQDAAEAEALRALADLCDRAPANVSALRELRLTLAEFRKVCAPPDDDLDAVAALIAALSRPTAASPD